MADERPGAGSETRLTAFARGAGCGCKLSAAELEAALGSMTEPVPTRPEVLIDLATADDAAVVRLDDATGLVQTVDFFTPIVDDPRTWGRIAATNALSDVYAMGGTPLSALSIVAWPRDVLGWDLLGQVLDGGAQVLAEAGCALVGGHSVDDAEPKYGLAVTGLVDPARVLANAGGRPGDVLVLTKPLGVGIITTAMKRDRATDRQADAAVAVMTERNDAASRAAVAVGCRGATDVTGFGLVGHLAELARASGVAAEVDLGALPVLDGVRDLIGAGCAPGGTMRNLEGAGTVDWGDAAHQDRVVACDAQTSGGLLVAVPPAARDRFHEELAAQGGGPATDVGRLVEPGALGSGGSGGAAPLIRAR